MVFSKEIMIAARRGRLCLALILAVMLAAMGQPLAAQSVVSPNPQFAGSPLQPLLAWDVADDGTVFVLDASNRVYQLDPQTLAPVASSARLEEHFSGESAALVAVEDYVYAGGGALRSTYLLARDGLRPVATLGQSELLAVDPVTDHIFALVPSRPRFDGSPPAQALHLYDTGDLERPAQILFTTNGLDRISDIAVDAAGRRLYLRIAGYRAVSSHGSDTYQIFDLDTLQAVGEIRTPEPHYGSLSSIAFAEDAGLMLIAYTASIGLPTTSRLLVLDEAGEIVREMPGLAGIPRTDSATGTIYLLRDRGLWVLDGPSGEFLTALPFNGPAPADVQVSPNGQLLYLLGNGWLTVYPASDLNAAQNLLVRPLPPYWGQARYFGSADGAIRFALYDPSFGDFSELYLSPSEGLYWYLMGDFGYPDPVDVESVSISPSFAVDQGAVLQPRYGGDLLRFRETDAPWQAWEPPELAFVSDRAGSRDVYVLDEADGTPRLLTDDPADDENPAWSPGWTDVVFQSNRSDNWDLYSVAADCSPDPCEAYRLTEGAGDNMLPAWSPDGRWIAFVSTRDGNPEIYIMDWRGQNEYRLTFDEGGDWRPAWLPDSRHLVFTSDRDGDNDLYLMQVPFSFIELGEREPKLTPLVTGPADDRDPAVSGDGRLLFLSDRDGVPRPYVANLASRDGTEIYAELPADLLPSAAGSYGHPTWSPSGEAFVVVGEDEQSDIFRVTENGQGMDTELVPVVTSPGFDGHPAGAPVWWQPEPSSSYVGPLP